jgi:sirohydrochlorin cobaltochelatase
MPDETLLLIGHGTRDPRGARELHAFADAVAAASRMRGEPRRVLPCFLELADPPIIAAVEQAVATGVHHIVAVPLLLQAARHMKNDIPTALNWARARYPAVHIAFGTPLGVRAEVLAALEERVAAVEEGLPALPAAETAVLLVERGSSDPDANADVFKVARLLWEGRGGGLVETCFWSITGPNLAEGLRRCAALGARRIIVLPYFLFQGILLQRIAAMVEEHRALLAGIEVLRAPHLGTHPALVDLVLHRAREATAGEARSNCDLCKYRVVMPGCAHDQGRPQGSDHAHGLRGHHEHGDQRHPFLTS